MDAIVGSDRQAATRFGQQNVRQRARLLALGGRVRQGASVLGIVAFSVTATLLVQYLMTPPGAQAQTGPQVVRTSGFELVSPEGAILARLVPGPQGGGNLTMFDAAGNRRTVVAGNGTIAAFDLGSTTLRFFEGYSTVATGLPTVNGVALGPDGTVGILSGCTGAVSC